MYGIERHFTSDSQSCLGCPIGVADFVVTSVKSSLKKNARYLLSCSESFSFRHSLKIKKIKSVKAPEMVPQVKAIHHKLVISLHVTALEDTLK